MILLTNNNKTQTPSFEPEKINNKLIKTIKNYVRQPKYTATQ